MSSFLERYRTFARKVTDAPYIFHDLLAYGALAVAVGNRWKLRYFGGGWLTPHLWILLLAESSTFHKSEALRVARRVLAKLPDRQLAWNGSHKALIEQFSATPQGVMFAFEFEQFLGVLRQNYLSGGRGLFTDLYDGELPASVYKNTGAQAAQESLAISFFAASTPSQLADWMKERDVMAGLLPRFILLNAHSQEQQFALPPADDGKVDATLAGLQDYLRGLGGTSGIMVLTPGAIKLYEAWYKRLGQTALDGTRADAWKTRLATVAIKLAMLNQLDMDWKGKVGEKAMYEATTLSTMLLQHVGHVCQEELTLSPYEEQAKRLRVVLSKYSQPGQVGYGSDGWLPWSFVLPHMHMPADQLRKVVSTLVQGQQIEWREKAPQGLRLVKREPGEDDR
mgnify:FL=1